jgi:tRNA uridine 5-carboxymethylaminomethyl modification enzyme
VDTASKRLSEIGRRVGLLETSRSEAAGARWRRIDETVEALEKERLNLDEAHRATTADLLRRPEIDVEQIADRSALLSGLGDRDRRVVAETIKYAGYVERQRREAERIEKAGSRRIPDGFVYDALSGLSNELTEKLQRVRPDSLGRASRIDGMTPVALALLATHLERRPRDRAR